jgi:hypothetical protein
MFVGAMKDRRTGIAIGLIAATVYGLALRLLAQYQPLGDVVAVMSLAYIVVVPLVVGFLTVHPHPSPHWLYSLFAPWLPMIVGTTIVALTGWEGSICIVMGLPILLVCASAGGLVGALVRPRSPAPVVVFVALPLLVGGIERRVPEPVQVREVASAIDIPAAPARVWSEIVQVREIAPAELPQALYLRMGFPRPLSATIDHPGVGGVRRATFTGGLVFHETVTDFEPERRLSFRIAAQTDSIPPTTLDRHVTIGGPYFDVLQGTYVIEPLPSRDVRLHLTSRLRVSTHFNPYAGPWADAIMRSIQETILVVEKHRAESAA